MRQRRLKNEINVVPYIDVMLVLLVIFMVATPMMTTGSVELPASGTAPQKPDKFLRVQVDKDGALSLYDANGKEQKLDGVRDLRSALAGQREREPEIAVLVAGDKEVPYRSVIEALDEVKKQGFARVALETSVK
ncbi:cell division and transport-associated protein TolR [Azonexus fungiphilus]|jgi:biopolymer transport protein TolR|uniref:Cell division and transport-associated protein TolR n=1 Tax=Azonexus fungiphilus TaxID=146940 RepID=A0A495VPC5_9RHOO|nr:protein TolR [Azonexus fungiphilus]NHC08546.1 protein TolR [Azonexus fungiphilus]RKT51251.1 cell division and transport-associated protein TolR [Azonexus fungiphilus]